MREDGAVTSPDDAAEMPNDDARSASVVPVVRSSVPALPPMLEGGIDVAVGAAVLVARPVVGAGAFVAHALAPAARVAWALARRPPLVPEAWTPAQLAERVADRGRRVRRAGGEDLAVVGGQALDVLVPSVLDPVLDRLDLTALVLARVDLDRLVTAVLDSMDLTEVVLSRVDLQRLVETAIASIDLTEIVRTQVDLAGIAEQVIDEVNLPDIIRESSTGVASEVVDTARISAVAGDELVNRWIDRILQRRKARRTAVPADQADPQEPVGESGDG
jgi:hypothetical protein